MNILVVQCSLNREGSATRAMVAAYLAALPPGARVVERDLAADPVPHLVPEEAAAIRGKEGADAAALGRSDALLAELEDADVLVLGVPMYNFTVPSSLKAWIDNVVRARRTFRYDEQGRSHGLIDPAKRVVALLSSDGIYSSGPEAFRDHLEPYLRMIMGFMGLTDVTVVRAEGQAVPGMGEQSRAAAIDAARALARAG